MTQDPPSRQEDFRVSPVPLLDALPGRPLRAGDLCPACQHGKLDYDGLLNLACPECGYAQGGCFG